MGGSAKGEFGETKGSKVQEILDGISDALAIASLIPGLDTFIDLASIPIDLARGDYISAGLDLLGTVPFAGEVADTARIARTADKAVEAVKAGKKVSNFSDFPKKIHAGRQGKHIIGHNNYKEGRSIFAGTAEDAQNLINKYAGKGERAGNKERVEFGKVIGEYVDNRTGKSYKTTRGIIHYSKDGAHIVPSRPNGMKGD